MGFSSCDPKGALMPDVQITNIRRGDQVIAADGVARVVASSSHDTTSSDGVVFTRYELTFTDGSEPLRAPHASTVSLV